jgi:hypothetical protein
MQLSGTVLNSTAGIGVDCYSECMTSKPIAADGSAERWAAWQARAEAHDRTNRRRMLMLAAIVSLFAVLLSVW